MRGTDPSSLLIGGRRHIPPPGAGFHPCCSGLQVQGTAISPTIAALPRAETLRQAIGYFITPRRNYQLFFSRRPERAPETAQPTAHMTEKVEADLLATEPVEEIGPWEFAALYRATEDLAEKQRIGEALEAQGYFSAAVPLSWEHQDYMRTYCHLYGCPYPLALAVADWETRGQFNMDAVGPAGEVGIFQLNPGPDGAYHAELEAATGLDPTTPEGNIAGGCYLLGKYMARYEDETMTAMAYNLGQAGARRAWAAGITSTEYTDAVLAALEMWECAVNAWAGE